MYIVNRYVCMLGYLLELQIYKIIKDGGAIKIKMKVVNDIILHTKKGMLKILFRLYSDSFAVSSPLISLHLIPISLRKLLYLSHFSLFEKHKTFCVCADMHLVCHLTSNAYLLVDGRALIRLQHSPRIQLGR